MLMSSFHHSLIGIFLPERAHDAVFFHDPPDSFQIVDNLKLTLQCHLDGTGAFLASFEMISF